MPLLLLYITGVAVAALLLGDGRQRPPLLVTLAIGLSLGPLCGGACYWLLLALDRSAWFLPATSCLALALSAWSAWTVWRSGATEQRDAADRLAVDWPVVALALIGLAGVLALMAVLPLGDWDAWATWNMKARFLGDADTWRRVFDAALVNARPNYPLLLPATVQGAQTLAATSWTIRLIHLGFAASLLLLAASGVATATPRGRRLLVLLLVTAPFVPRHLASQYADVPLAALVFAAVVLAQRLRQLPDRAGILLGLLCGLLPLIKDEGSLFLLVIAPFALWQDRPKLPRRAATLLTGALLPLVGLALHKLFFTSPSLVFNRSLSAMGADLLDPARWRTVTAYFGVEVLRFNRWLIWLPLGLVAAALTLRQASRAQLPLALAIAVVLGGFFAVFLIAPVAPLWHLASTSWPRLIFQLWPLIALLTAQVIERWPSAWLPPWLDWGLSPAPEQAHPPTR